MAKTLNSHTDAYGNKWLIEEVDFNLTGSGEVYVYLSVNGIMITMPIPKSAFKTTYNNAFFNTIRQKIANV